MAFFSLLYYATSESLFQFNLSSKVTKLLASKVSISSGLFFVKEENSLVWISKTGKRSGLNDIYQIEYLKLREGSRSEHFCTLLDLRFVKADLLVSRNGQFLVGDVHGTFWTAKRVNQNGRYVTKVKIIVKMNVI